MNDDAIAPVIAVMMILVVAVTLLSIWNAIYLPDLKQQAEMEHLKEVENSFVNIDENIRKMIIFQSNGELTESVPLGGGDIMLNQAKSGGVLSIHQYEDPIVEIYHGSSIYQTFMIKNISYSPSSNFWVNQGYEWKDGVIYAEKGKISVPRFYVVDTQAKENWFYTVCQPGSDFILSNVTVENPLSISGNGIAHIKMNGTLSKNTLSSGTIIIDTSTDLGKEIDATVSRFPSYFSGSSGVYNILETGTVRLYNLTISIQ